MIDACAAPTFRNDDWFLSEDGLEHRNGYFIGRGVIDARRDEGLWDWPLQMAEKRWCRPSLFREAFLAALDLFGLERDEGLGRSFALGFGIRAGQGAGEGFQALGDLLRPGGRNEAEAPLPVRHAARIAVRA